MWNLSLLALAAVSTDAAKTPSGRRGKKIYDQNLQKFLRNVGGAKANCGNYDTNNHYNILKDYLINENGQLSYYSNVPEAGNKLSDKSLAKITALEDNVSLTHGNGWCDKNTYRSWNKCTLGGTCFTTCEDGNCYDEMRNGGEEIEIPDGCKFWMLKCARECTEDPNCAAWSFRNTNVLGNAQYTCNLMGEVLCSRSELNHGDPRSVYHVKASAVQAMFDQYQVNTVEELEAAKFDVEDMNVNVWSSWGYHTCNTLQPTGEKCGVGFNKRQRVNSQGQTEVERRPCVFADSIGNEKECVMVVEEDPIINHGWMEWGDWTVCSRSCGDQGIKKRTRRCGKCAQADGDSEGLCLNPTDPIYKIDADLHPHCAVENQGEFASCEQAKCLPWSNGRTGAAKYINKNGWQTFQTNGPTGLRSDYEGGCVDYDVDSVGVKVKITNSERAFADCLRFCQDAGADCLSATYFPRIKAPWWNPFFRGTDNNCFLHKRRCHEDAVFRDASFVATQPSLDSVPREEQQKSAPSWYAYKDLCSNTLICDRWGRNWEEPYYASICDSTGENAFPNQPTCTCPFSQDERSGVRAWGNPFGPNFYNEASKRVESRRANPEVQQRAVFYSEKKYWHGVPDFMNSIPNGILPCHDPCRHNECSTLAECVFNADSPIGYDCVCQWPSMMDDSRFGGNGQYAGFAGLRGKNGCQNFEFRNSEANDNGILFGGGWNTLKDPGQARPVKPHTAYYELSATSDPWTFNVAEVTRIPPTSPNSVKGRFYNCIVNLSHNKMMVVAGKSGQFFDAFDDKTMVYEWDGAMDNGKWVGLDGEDMDAQECQGEIDEDGAQSGCIRDGEWPDLPHTPISECKGQCRGGAAGKGPTSVHWINSYCNIDADYYNVQTDAWESRQFQLCDLKIVQDASGEKIDGKSGKWIAVENTELPQQRHQFNQAVIASFPFFGAIGLRPLDIDEQDDSMTTTDSNGMRVLNYWRWKTGRMLPSNMYSPMLGILSSFFHQRPHQGQLKLNSHSRTYYGMGQPLCGLVGDRVYTGSGAVGRLFSLSKTPSTVKKEKVWRMEAGSEFPINHKRSDGTACMTNHQIKDGVPLEFQPLDARRQNYGTVVTTEGLWMIGGLLESAADLPARERSDMYNIDGCTKRAHMQDVWVFNPNGWSREQILGDAVNKYSGMSESDILPTIQGYPFSRDVVEKAAINQTFESFRLYDETDGVSIAQAQEEGWECTGVDGKWCRKPFLNRHTKGAESQVMCFEYQSGNEDRTLSSPNAQTGDEIPRRPRYCSIDETADSNNNCICYIIQASGQSGPKQQLDGAGFRPEIDYLEVRRADGTWGSDKAFYKAKVSEWCPNASKVFPADPEIQQDNESAVSDSTQCTSRCGLANQPACNREWKKKNLRRRWHEAGRIRYGRMGSLSGVLKGELMLWGGECYGDSTVREFGPDGLLRGLQSVMKPRPCRMVNEPSGKRKAGDYIEAFSFVRMNKAGFLFGERRQVDLVGFPVGSASHDESATSQAFSMFNTIHE